MCKKRLTFLVFFLFISFYNCRFFEIPLAYLVPGDCPSVTVVAVTSVNDLKKRPLDEMQINQH